MFEKEAKEYQIRKHHQRLYGHKPVVMKELNTTFKDGAEFGYNKAKKEMQAQIEKMKCCENCKHSDTECEGYTICGIGHYDDCLSNKVLYHTTDEKDYWELEEND